MVKHFLAQPLPSSFMIISILGFLFSTLFIWEMDITWGFTLTVFFLIMFLAAVYNFTQAEGEEHLDIHDTNYHKRKSPLYDAK